MDHIDSIRKQAEAAKLAAAAAYQKLADDMARGERPPADVLDILSRAGRTADDLEQSVRVARERLHLEPKAAALKQIQTDLAAAERELRAADERASGELAEFQRRMAERLDPLRAEVARLREAEQESRNAKSRLQHISQRPAEARRHMPAIPVEESE